MKSAAQYVTVSRVIEYIVAKRLGETDMSTLAKSLKMSLGHLQKVFTEWVGISPKQFGRYLSLEYSKGLLAQNKKTFETTVRTGLSSGGRLHDLFVDIEAMTPGEYQRHGEGLVIYYSIFETKFGLCLAASTDRGICNILFADSEKGLMRDLRSRWSKAKFVKKTQLAHTQIQKYFAGINPKSKIKLHLHGTNFQIKVWEALLSIPEGNISTYGDIATRLGDKKLARAVGMAVGDNPIGYIIPCHRVLKSSGEISGYHWGIERKRAMLGYEAIRKNG